MPEIIEISDINDSELDIFARLNETQLLHYREPDKGLFIAESPNVILRAIDAGYEPISFLVERSELDKEYKQFEIRFPDVKVFAANLEVISKITGYKMTRGLLCAMNRAELPGVNDIIRDKMRIVVLEDVMNPTNVGAIFRSAAALGMEAVLLTKGSSDPLYRRAARVSMGTVFQIPWTFIEEEDYLEYLKVQGFKTVAMALTENSVGIDDETLNCEEKLAVIMGTEGEGLKKETIKHSDYVVKIPMSHGVDSLNVAAASAVAFWQLGMHK